jgi:opacity protein-like surface antigen
MKRTFFPALLGASLMAPVAVAVAPAQIIAILYSGVDIPQRNFGGDVGISTSPGLGGGVSLHRRGKGSDIAIGIALGAQQFSAKAESGTSKFTYKLLAVPIVASGQYYIPAESFTSYVGLSVGYCYTNYEVRDSGKTRSIPHSGFTAEPNAGLRFKATPTVDLDLNLGYRFVNHGAIDFGNYFSATNFSTIALKIGLGYSF